MWSTSLFLFFFFSSRRRHTRCALVTGVQTCALPIYLAGPLGHCIECHSPMGPQGPDWQNQTGAGGMQFPGPWGISHSSNITPTNLADWSDADLKKVITTGQRPDGSRLLPPMPVGYYRNITERDLDALEIGRAHVCNP